MNTLVRTIIFIGLLSVFACGRESFVVSPEALQDAQNHYDSGFVMLQQDSLLAAFPHFIQVAEKLEVLPNDMTDEEKLLASRAYYQMAHVFGWKMENNAEIDALRWALGYQRQVGDTTWMAWTSLKLANAFWTVKEVDSARFYLDWVMPHLDTVPDNVRDYITARHLLASLYLEGKQLDSSLMVQREIIAFKMRRGMDTKGDSVSMGMNLFFSGRKTESKTYLLKILDMERDDVEKGAIMSLLAQVYEEEQNADSLVFCQSFHTSYVQAESERVSDGMLAVKQYEQFKAERDTRLQALREQKASQKRNTYLLLGGLAFFMLVAIIAVVFKRRKKDNVSFAQSWAQFEQSEIFLRIRERLAADGGKISSKNVDDFFNLALGQADFVALKDAVDAAFGGFASRLAERYPDLSSADLNACCLALTGLSHAEMAVLQGVKYNSFTNRITKIKKILGTEENLSTCLKNMLKVG